MEEDDKNKKPSSDLCISTSRSFAGAVAAVACRAATDHLLFAFSISGLLAVPCPTPASTSKLNNSFALLPGLVSVQVLDRSVDLVFDAGIGRLVIASLEFGGRGD